MEILDSGESLPEVAKRFHIGKTTLYEWQQRRKETGDFQSKKPGSVGYGHKITDWEAFKIFAERYGHQTQSEMADLWEGDISRQTISRALKKINFTRKKRHTAIRNEMKKNEQIL